MEPTVSGPPDLRYLDAALARAGMGASNATELATEPLTDGRTGASVTRLTAIGAGSRRSFVLKVVPRVEWRASLGLDGAEARLWLSAVTRTLPAGLRCPTLDIAKDASGNWWILMDDVSRGIAARGTFDAANARALMTSIARMHARYWGRDRELAALPTFETSANGFARLMAHVGEGEPAGADEPWLAGLADDFRVARMLLPTLLGALSSADGDFYLQLCRDHPRIVATLASHPRTLIHGDLRRANIAYIDSDVALFDWELAGSAPAARDLQWYWFLQFWAYPPANAPVPADRRGGLDVYLATLEREGVAVDRPQFEASCDLAWLSVFCQLGCCLADPLSDAAPSADAIARAKRCIADAIDLARRIQDRHVR